MEDFVRLEGNSRGETSSCLMFESNLLWRKGIPPGEGYRDWERYSRDEGFKIRRYHVL